MSEIRKLPDDDLLELAAQVEAEAARAVDERFACMVNDGRFDEVAAQALSLKTEMDFTGGNRGNGDSID